MSEDTWVPVTEFEKKFYSELVEIESLENRILHMKKSTPKEFREFLIVCRGVAELRGLVMVGPNR